MASEAIRNLENLLYGNTSSEAKLDSFLNISKVANIHQLLEDERRSPVRQIVLILSYTLLVVISLFGNLLVCFVIFKTSRLHTATNLFIANLAVSDLLITCINIPFNIARNLLDEWPFGSVMCHLVNFSLMVSVYVSTFTLLAIALDRQKVLLYPLSPRISRQIALIELCIIWLFAVCLSLPYGLSNKVQTVDFIFKEVQRCTSSFPEPGDLWEKCLTAVTFLLQYVIPITVIGVTYGRIVRKLWVRSLVGAVTENQQENQRKAKIQSVKMLIVVAIVFGLCWLPLNLYQFLTDFCPSVRTFHYSSNAFFICHWIAVSSTCFNPFVYCWWNERFRAEVKSRFEGCLPRSRRVHPRTEVNGSLLEVDRTFHRSCSKSFNRAYVMSLFKSSGKSKSESDSSNTRDHVEQTTELTGSQGCDVCFSK